MSETVAVIPARGGSKGVPGKNLRRVGGIPLVARAIAAARRATGIDRIVVSTDDRDVASVAAEWGADIVHRPAELSGDEASSESALLHTLDVLADRGIVVATLAFLQATSPFIDTAALADAIRRVRGGEADSALSVVETYGFLWRRTDDGAAGVNHDAARRPRRQDREPHFLETGAFYVMDASAFRAAGHRFFGRIALVEVQEQTALEIDTPEQLEIARRLAADMGQDVAVPMDVDAVVTDFDGVHTDDTAVVSGDGAEQVRVSRSDGMGVRLLREAGVPLLILSTETHPVVAARARKLGVEVVQALDDKATTLRRWAADRGIPLSRVAFVGNDVNDLAALEIVGWPVAVPDAHPLVLAAARVVLDRPGGAGAVRDLADRVLRARDDRTGLRRSAADAAPKEAP